MILSYDHLIDTREKRTSFVSLLFIVMAILFLIPYVILGCYLLTIASYSDLYSLLRLPMLSMCYIARIILDGISLSSFTISSLGGILFQNIATMELLMGLCFLLALNILLKKKQTTFCLWLLIIEAITCLVMMKFALSSVSLSAAILYVRYIGAVFLGCNTILLCMLFHGLLKEAKRYRKALAWQVEEIKEHKEI